MPLYLIRITKRNWDRDEFDASWLGPNEAPADVHQDLRISQSALSVWHIDDDKSNLNQVITALASTRDVCDTFDFGLFNQEIASECELKIAISAGLTPLTNANHWHRDLSELTVEKLAILIKSIFDVMNKDRRTKRQIQSQIIGAVKSGQVDLSGLKPKMQEQINREIDEQ